VNLFGYIFFQTFSFVCKVLPARAAAALGCLIGLGMAALDKRRGRILRHMNYAVGHARARDLVGRYYEHMGLLAVEAGRIDLYRPDNLHEWMEVEGLDRLQRILARGKGAIFLTGHVGNWELTGQALACLGLPLHVFIKPLKNPYLDRRLQGLREQCGMRVHRKGSGMRWIIRLLRDGEAYGLMNDQDAGVDGEFFPFFGVEASTVTTAARIARHAGAAIVPVTSYRLPCRTRSRLRIGPEVAVETGGEVGADVYATTLRCNRALEEAILEHPAQWIWSHRRWRTRPSGDAR